MQPIFIHPNVFLSILNKFVETQQNKGIFTNELITEDIKLKIASPLELSFKVLACSFEVILSNPVKSGIFTLF
jgi:hypothetical protein